MGVDWLTDEDVDSDHGPAEGPSKRVRLLDYACGTGMMSKVGRKKSLVALPRSVALTHGRGVYRRSHPIPHNAWGSISRKTWLEFTMHPRRTRYVCVCLRRGPSLQASQVHRGGATRRLERITVVSPSTPQLTP